MTAKQDANGSVLSETSNGLNLYPSSSVHRHSEQISPDDIAEILKPKQKQSRLKSGSQREFRSKGNVEEGRYRTNEESAPPKSTQKQEYGKDPPVPFLDASRINYLKKKKDSIRKRTKQRANKLLHTHVALILVCVLSTLDAGCVIGQIICDILIMSDELYKYDQLHLEAVEILFDLLPNHLNRTVHGKLDFESIVHHLEEDVNHGNHDNHSSSGAVHAGSGHEDDHTTNSEETHGHDASVHGSVLTIIDQSIHVRIARPVARSRRAAITAKAGEGSDSHDDSHSHEDHGVLDSLTHTFHLASMVILSVLLLETFLKIFAMGKHFLDHKLEVFDAFVVTVSWCLDVAFWEGIWHKPGTEGATILIIILPWRVCRIVNSFVLVIQEKDLVVLKVVKQRLRAALRREKDSTSKLDRYRLEVRQLQGLCRKSGADESAIQACCPAGKRRRSSLFQSLTSFASMAMISAMGSSPDLNISSDDDEAASSADKDSSSRRMSLDSTQSGTLSFSLSPTVDESPRTGGVDNKMFRFDNDTVTKLVGKQGKEKQTEKENGSALKTRL